MTTREFDVTVWGASGFTGRLVVDYLYRTYGCDGALRWAVGGRNAAKLTEVLGEVIGADAAKVPVVIADSSDEASLRSMVTNTRSVCTTVGPYALYGTKLVALCAELGTHYADLTGEVQWMRKMIDTYHGTAEASGARIVHTCGFDSIPSDMGTLFLQNAMYARHGEYATRIKYRVAGTSGGVSGGTIASMMNMMEEARHDPSIPDLLADPYALNPGNQPRGHDTGDQTSAEYDVDFRQWTGPFVMAAINTRVVRRTHSLLGYPWGENFRYDEAILTGDGPGGFARASMVAGGTRVMNSLTAWTPARNMLARVVPAPGEGPTPEAIAKGFFNIELFAAHPADPEKNMKAIVSGDRDPGYGATSKMIAESAVCLATDELSTPTGVLTPAVAMGEKLIERLQASAGMTFRLVD